MGTTHYDFPLVDGSDPIAFVDTFNGMANAFDSALYTVDGYASAASTKADTAISDAASASAAATAASSAATTAGNTANSASATAIAANSTAGATASALNAFEQKFNLTPVTVTSGLSVTGFTYALTLAQDSTGSIYKFYGNLVKAAGTSGSLTRVAIPGGTGDYTYGVDTGLVLEAEPDTAYLVSPAGVRCATNSSGNITSFVGCPFAVGTNGHIYIYPQSSSSGSVSTADRIANYFFPCIYVNTSFGEVGE